MIISKEKKDNRESTQRAPFSPTILLCVIAYATAILIHPGGFGIDTERRLQVAHSLWTDAPPMDPTVWPDFGVKGVNGVIHPQYGIGQSLVLLPADIVATAALSFTGLSDGLYKQAKIAIVAYLVFPVISMLAVLVCYRLLLLLGFLSRQSLLGAIGLLFCTTFFHYTQHNQENSLLFLSFISGIYFIAKWQQQGKPGHLILGAVIPGYSILIRLPSVFDFAAVFAFAAVIMAFKYRNGNATRRDSIKAFGSMVLVFVLVFIFFLFWDRFYQWKRFGSFFNSYWHLHAEEAKALNPDLPASYPFTLPFMTGFLGALFSLRRSVFLFDPLLALSIFLVLGFRRKLTIQIKALVIASAILLLALLSFYATFFDWAGSNAWGDRFAVVPVELLAVLGLAILARHYGELGRMWKAAAYVLIPLSVLIQLGSSVFTINLEEWQRFCLDVEFVVGLRFANIIGVLFNRADDWGLSCVKDFSNLTRLNYMPFKLQDLVYIVR